MLSKMESKILTLLILVKTYLLKISVKLLIQNTLSLKIPSTLS